MDCIGLVGIATENGVHCVLQLDLLEPFLHNLADSVPEQQHGIPRAGG